MKSPSIYIIMARLARITGMELSKIYENPQCTDMESQKGDVLLMSQTTQIKLKPKDCIFLAKSLVIQFTPKLFSTMSIPKQVR